MMRLSYLEILQHFLMLCKLNTGVYMLSIGICFRFFRMVRSLFKAVSPPDFYKGELPDVQPAEHCTVVGR